MSFGTFAENHDGANPSDGRNVLASTLLEVETGELRASLCDYGARLVSLEVPGRDGQVADVVLGFDEVANYVADPMYLGATCGRYGNRIRRGQFTIDQTGYEVDLNEPPNHLHGGRRGFDRALWSVEVDEGAGEVVFALESPDGDQGYPGTLRATTTYRFDGARVTIEMRAETDAPTIVNLVNHTYWNLAGHASGSVLGHELAIEADTYTPVDEENIPTGELVGVEGTPFDFRRSRMIGAEVSYDHNWVLRSSPDADADVRGGLRRAAIVRDPGSGRVMQLDTTAPGLQFYGGAALGGGPQGKGGVVYGPSAGLALESQVWPDSPNHAHFPDPTLRPGTTYSHDMVLTFSAE